MTKAVLTDIEGTTSSVSFVKDILFPYARRHIAEFVRSASDNPDVRKLLDEACAEVAAPMDDERLIEQLIAWIDEDKKVTALKSLQGLIWERGYKRGDFKGHIYADAAQTLKQWKAQGIRLYVFSSGSVQAQKLLFGNTDYGDLTKLFDAYFDTHIGSKLDPESYRRISIETALPAQEILFLSDVKAELDAARIAGMNTTWLVRDGAFDAPGEHPQVVSFDAISI